MVGVMGRLVCRESVHNVTWGKVGMNIIWSSVAQQKAANPIE